MIHHDPHSKPDRSAYERTYVDYRTQFGTPPKAVWPNPFARSGSGCGGAAAGGGDGDGGGSGCGGGGCGGGGG